MDQGAKGGAWKLTLGFWAKGTEARKDFGLMMYKDGRLVEYYKKYGIMSGRGGSGNWIQGVVEVPKAVEHVLTKDRFSNSDELLKVENQIKKVVSSWYNEFIREEKEKKQGLEGAGANVEKPAMGNGNSGKGGKGFKSKGVAKKAEEGAKRKLNCFMDDDDEEEAFEEERVGEEEDGLSFIDPPSTASAPPPPAPRILPVKVAAAPTHKKPQAQPSVPHGPPVIITLPPPMACLAQRGQEVGTQTNNVAIGSDEGSSRVIRGLEQQVQLLLRASADQMQRSDVLEREKIRLEMELDELKTKIRENHLQCFFGGTPVSVNGGVN